MSVTVTLYEHLPRVIYYHFESPWTWQEYEVAFQEELALAYLLDGQRYDVMANMTQGLHIPRGAGFTTLMRTVRLSPPTLDKVIAIGDSTLLNMMVNTLYRIYPNIRDSFCLVPSLETAHQILLEARQNELEETQDRRSFDLR